MFRAMPSTLSPSVASSVTNLSYTEFRLSPSSPSLFRSRSILNLRIVDQTNELRICTYSSRASSPVEGFSYEQSGDGSFFDSGEMMVEEEDSDDEEDDSDSSMDLLFRFLGSMFRKAARRAKKGLRSVLPPAIPLHLVSFAVDGVLLLASLSILKALLEVVCTIGGSVFAAILLLQVIWATTSYFQSNGNGSGSSFNQGRGTSFGTTQSAI